MPKNLGRPLRCFHVEGVILKENFIKTPKEINLGAVQGLFTCIPFEDRQIRVKGTLLTIKRLLLSMKKV